MRKEDGTRLSNILEVRVNEDAGSKKDSLVKSYVFDTFAILGWLSNEPAADKVEGILEGARNGKVKIYISWVNLCEVYYVTLRSCEGNDSSAVAMKVMETIKSLPVELVSAGEAETLAAGAFKALYSMSLADSYAAGLGKIHSAEVVTGDPEFEEAERAGEIKILWLPGKKK